MLARLCVQVRPVAAGTATLKDATSEAIRDWVTNVESTHYILGSAAGPHPYPMMVRASACAIRHRLEWESCIWRLSPKPSRGRRLGLVAARGRVADGTAQLGTRPERYAATTCAQQSPHAITLFCWCRCGTSRR